MAIDTNNKVISVWNYKPWWCQPWSIILTGVSIIGGSWLLFHTVWISVGISIPIAVWWVYFLILYPQMMKEYLEQSSNIQSE
ncbi:DUF6737 family protein [Myxosarcina sp. GI1]|uniref:DUF6737 family protein n=1 Tax=Myxosarcina sp. GI1 TaxID=1541065 RepID=UPI00055D6B3D|nr:DUF6737 family protein [Myxosarcina sp. GI1]